MTAPWTASIPPGSRERASTPNVGASARRSVSEWISPWIDLAYSPEGEGRGADLAEYRDRNQRN